MTQKAAKSTPCIEVDVQAWYLVNTKLLNLENAGKSFYRLANALAATIVTCPPGRVAACLGWRAVRLFRLA